MRHIGTRQIPWPMRSTRMIIDCGILFPVVSEGLSEYHQFWEGPYQRSCFSFVRKKSLSSSKAFGELAFLSLLWSSGVPTGSAFCFGLPTPVSHPCLSHPPTPIHKFLLLPEAWGREALSLAFPVLTYSLIPEDWPTYPSRSWNIGFLCCQPGSAISPTSCLTSQGHVRRWTPFVALASNPIHFCFSPLNSSDASSLPVT